MAWQLRLTVYQIIRVPSMNIKMSKTREAGSISDWSPHRFNGIAPQTGPLKWQGNSNWSSHKISKYEYGLMASQTGPLTGIFKNLIPLSRISLSIKPCSFYQLESNKSWEFVSLWLNLVSLDHVQECWTLAHSLLLTGPLTGVHRTPF